jgi:hypothetical protein
VGDLCLGLLRVLLEERPAHIGRCEAVLVGGPVLLVPVVGEVVLQSGDRGECVSVAGRWPAARPGAILGRCL